MKFSKEDLDWITTWTGCTAAVCIGIASTIATTLSSVPGDKVFGIDKASMTAVSTLIGGVGAIALGVKSVFTNKTATTSPTTADLERQASVQEQAEFFKYSAQGAEEKRPAYSSASLSQSSQETAHRGYPAIDESELQQYSQRGMRSDDVNLEYVPSIEYPVAAVREQLLAAINQQGEGKVSRDSREVAAVSQQPFTAKPEATVIEQCDDQP